MRPTQADRLARERAFSEELNRLRQQAREAHHQQSAQAQEVRHV